MLYFIDESGHDHGASPYEVLAAVAVKERDLWNLIQSIRSAELELFGVAFADVGIEFKGTKLLKKKTFRLAGEGDPVPADERRDLVRALVIRGHEAEKTGAQAVVTFRELVAYGQTVVAFIERVFRLMGRYRVKTFAAMVDPAAPRPADKSFFRRDYAFLFERFFYHLEATSAEETGLIVFDELEKAQSRILLEQMGNYFLKSEKGYQRSSRILPEPFFVHSDLTTAVQLADLVAYCASWAIRLNQMVKPIRPEMKSLADLVFDLRFVGSRFDEQDGKEWPVYGMFYLDDLRPKSQRE
ncbi:MAG TPA: DUF3800 domain-containing protein [Verrucomicrobiae bacterium]|nr:DUF3800 domain-containing protein [Verrucomicrobiae bacterium]